MADSSTERDEAAAKLKEGVKRDYPEEPASLDDLIEMLDADDLRNVTGMLRPKGPGGGGKQ